MSPAVLASLALLSFCCASGTGAAEAAGDTVSARQPLRGNETVVSAQGKFELGFFSPNGSDRFYLGIWYKNVPLQTVIWIGNRASPLLSDVQSAELRVSPDDGILELVGLSESSAPPAVVWSSNMSSSRSSSSSPGSNVAVMRDNGNLVLLDGANSSNVLWQSFDHPTDTLVPEAWLGENKLTGEYQTLTSWRNAEDPAPGMFSSAIDPNGSSQFYLWNGSRAYCRSGVWTGRFFANLPEAENNVLFNQTYVETPGYRRITSVLYNNATITRLVLDLTGQTKQYIWDSGSPTARAGSSSGPRPPCSATCTRSAGALVSATRGPSRRASAHQDSRRRQSTSGASATGAADANGACRCIARAKVRRMDSWNSRT